MSKSSKKEWHDLPKTENLFAENIFKDSCRKSILDVINKQINLRKKTRLRHNCDCYSFNCSEENDPKNIARKNQMFIEGFSSSVNRSKPTIMQQILETTDKDINNQINKKDNLNFHFDSNMHLKNQSFIEKNTPIIKNRNDPGVDENYMEMSTTYDNYQISNLYFCCVVCKNTRPITQKFLSYSVDRISNCSFIAVCENCKDKFDYCDHL